MSSSDDISFGTLGAGFAGWGSSCRGSWPSSAGARAAADFGARRKLNRSGYFEESWGCSKELTELALRVLGEVGVADREHEHSLLHSAGRCVLSAGCPGTPIEPPLVLAYLGLAAKAVQVLLLQVLLSLVIVPAGPVGLPGPAAGD